MKRIPTAARKHNKYYQNSTYNRIIQEEEKKKKTAAKDSKPKRDPNWKYKMWVRFYMNKGAGIDLATAMARSKIEEGEK